MKGKRERPINTRFVLQGSLRVLRMDTDPHWLSDQIYEIRTQWGIVKTATGQNGDKSKRLQVESKRINLLSSTMDLFRVLLTKFQLIQLCSFWSAVISKISRAQICFALTSSIARDGILYFFHIINSCMPNLWPTVDYIGVNRPVGLFGFVAVLTIAISVAVLTTDRHNNPSVDTPRHWTTSILHN